MPLSLRTVALVGTALLAPIVVAGGLCRFVVDCHLRELGPLSVFANEPGPLEGIHEQGTGRTTLPAGFTQEVVARGLALPTSFAFLPDGRIVVGEKGGVVKLVEDGRVLAPPLLDISARVATAGLRGLLAVEPHPEFEENGLLYVLYVREDGVTPEDGPKRDVVSRFTVDGDRAAASGEQVVLGGASTSECDPTSMRPRTCLPVEGEHAGGTIAFDDDGAMFVSTGDGSNGKPSFYELRLRAQDVAWASGKILRTSDDGEGLPSNPFWDGDPGSMRSKVWAYGLRNPFRFARRPGTDSLFVGDVGWNDREEIDVVVRGANYGWPCYEGTMRPDEYSDHRVCRSLYARSARDVRGPLLEYGSASVTGGVFYTASSFPDEHRGAYFFADWMTSEIRYVRGGDLASARPSSRRFGANAGGPVQLRVGPDGALYYLALNSGELRRITYVG